MLYTNVLNSLELYLQKDPDPDVQELFVAAKENPDIIKRSNEEGHFTASGLVIYEEKLLLIFHKKLQMYLQPGGHLEDDESLVAAAQREVLEETGIKTTPHNSKGNESEIVLPLHIDIHTIPENEKKGEPEHKHYDCMFLLQTDNSVVDLQLEEVEGYQWVLLDYPFKDIGLVKAVEKIKLGMRL